MAEFVTNEEGPAGEGAEEAGEQNGQVHRLLARVWTTGHLRGARGSLRTLIVRVRALMS